ncbi:MAG: YafY family protein [Myxococcota bacterium]
MLETSARLLELLGLFQARRLWPGTELADRLGVTPRTLRRDVERLRALGYAVEAASGPGGGYQFAGGHLPPLLLSEDEAVALTVALRTALSTPGVPGERALAVLTKLERVLPDRLRPQVAALHEQTVVLARTVAPVDPSTLTRLAAACRDSEAAQIRYRTHGGEVSERTVHPLRLVHTGNQRWYLVAWDVAREDWRTLRVDRVEAVLRIGPRVVRAEPPEDVAQYVSDAVSRAAYPCQGAFELQLGAEAAAAAIPPWIGALTPLSPDTCRLDVGAGSWDAVAMYGAMAGVPFRVLGPEPLREAVRAMAARFAAA